MIIKTIRLRGDAFSGKVWLDGKELKPRRSQAYYNHSPDGFNWGYGGSGPAQLALAIMLECFDVSDHYQNFKWAVISKLEISKDFSVEIQFEDVEHLYKATFMHVQ